MPWRAVLLVVLALALPSPSPAQTTADLSAVAQSAKADTRLAEAVSRRDTAVVRSLLSQKSDVNAVDVGFVCTGFESTSP